jgi:hypothetical protein
VDSKQIAEKFNIINSKQSGFSKRSQSSWKVIYGDKETHLFTALDENKNILGYIIVFFRLYASARIVAIAEICAWEKENQVISALLRQAEVYAKQINASALVTWENNAQINSEFNKFGFFVAGKSIFSLGITSIDYFKRTLNTDNYESSIQDWRVLAKKVRIKIASHEPALSGEFTLEINGKITRIYENGSSDDIFANLETDLVSFSEIIYKIKNPWLLLLQRKLVVRPVFKTAQVINILQSISRKANWFVPFGDYF